jgi:hypothetical protein
MRRIFSLLIISSLAVACGPLREDVEVDWTFAGRACDAAGVATIRVDIDGEVLSPNTFTCAEASLGADLGTYLTGDYTVTISGYDGQGTLTYQTTTTLQVRRGGKNTFNVDVAQVAQTTGDVTLHWTFNGQTCSQAGVTTMHVSADNQVITTDSNSADIPCSSNGTDGTTIGPFPAGSHSFDLVGFDSGGHAKFALNSFSATVVAGQNAVVTPDLKAAAPTTASADLTWTFDGKSCSAAGVSQVQIFVDPDANGNGGVNAGTIACNSMGTDGGSVDGLTQGNHSFAIYGIDSTSHLRYRTHHPPSAYFAIGLITSVSVSAESPP